MRCKILPVLAFSLGLFSCATMKTPPPKAVDVSAYKTVTVLPFAGQGFRDHSGSEFADQVVIELMKQHPRLTIVDPAALGGDYRPAAAGDSASGHVSFASLGADLVITGTFSLRMEDLVRTDSLRQAYASATVRAVDAHTGRIIWAGRMTEESERRLHSFVSTSDAELRQDAMEALARKIAQNFTAP
jgi:hypothetical protein